MMVAVIMLGGLMAVHPGSAAAKADDSSLVISQFKITSRDGQFITLYNTTDSALDMGKYRLEYFNSYDLDKATSSRLIALSGTVPPHGYYMVNDDALLLCYRLTVYSASLRFSSTAGMVQVVAFNQDGPGGSAEPALQDYAAWSKKDAAGALTLPEDTSEFFRRQPANQQGDPRISTPGAGDWQAVHPDGDNPCELTAYGPASTSTPAGHGGLLPSAEPPATIVRPGSGPDKSAFPKMDIGLKAPAITELLPNPDGTGTDETDEFIELYNPNGKPFDLSGFSLQTGTTRKHTYVFPKDFSLPPQSFKVFYSKTTDLSLSNTTGQARLLDPSGGSVSDAAEYEKAKDGITWALAKGKWYWTTKPTPGKPNVIKDPDAKDSPNTAVRGRSGSSTDSSTDRPAAAEADARSTPIHTRALVLIASLALLYGAYEYRADLANRIYKFRQHFGARYEDGS